MIFNHRKGQIGMQFNWIFVLIVGGIILGFFFIIVTNQQKKATVEEAQDLIERLDTLFTTIDKQPNAVDSFRIPHAKIEFTCEPGLSNYYIQDVGPIQTAYDVIATQKLLEGNKIITWTRTWEVPYEATSITNMANDRTLFVFVDNGPSGEYIINRSWYEMPDEFNKLKLDTPLDIASKISRGFDRYVFVTSYSTISSGGGLELVFGAIATSDELIVSKSVIRGLKEDSDIEGMGTVAFISMEGVTSSTLYKPAFATEEPFLYMPTLWAAIFTEDAATYDCTMQKALFKLNVTTQILNERAGMIANELAGTTCLDYFTDAQKDYTAIQSATNKGLNGLQRIYKVGEAEGTVGTPSLEKLAGVSLRGYNCPYIY